jgi:Fe-S-cluster-containing hydrogenase component 2
LKRSLGKACDDGKKKKAIDKLVYHLELCTMCNLCIEACPSDAIIWEKGKIAYLDKEKCTKCKSCYDACRFMAIE